MSDVIQCVVCLETFRRKWSIKRHFKTHKHYYEARIPEEVKAIVPNNVPYNVTKFSKEIPHMVQICLPTIYTLKDFEIWMEKFIATHKCNFVRHYVKKDETSLSSFQVMYYCEYRGVHKVKANTKTTGCRSTIYAVGKSAESNYINVRLNLCHNHVIRPLYPKPSAEIKNIFLCMFENGCKIKESIENFSIHIRNQIHSKSEYLKYISDKQNFPDYHWVWSLHKQFTNSKLNFQKNQEVMKSLKEFVLRKNFEYKEHVCEIEEYDENNFSIAISTSSMKNILKFQNNGIILIDSISSIEKFGFKIILFICQTKEGGAPIGVIITTNDTTPYIPKSFQLYLELIDSNMLSNESSDLTVMINDGTDNSVIKTVFSKSNIILCTFYVVMNIYKYFLKPENDLNDKQRNTMYFNLYKSIISRTEIQANYYFQQMKNCSKNTHLMKYLENWYKKKEKWMLCYRKPNQIKNTNFLEQLSRALKELIVHKIKTVSLTQLIDYFTSTDFSRNYKIDDFNDFLMNSNFSKRYTISNSDINNYCFEQSLDCSSIYKVHNKLKKTIYEINCDLGVCSCFIGINGSFCKHQEILSCYIPQFRHPLQYVEKRSLMESSEFDFVLPETEKNLENVEVSSEERVVCYEEILVAEDFIEELENLHKEPEEIFSEFKMLSNRMILMLQNDLEYYEDGMESYMGVLKDAMKTPKTLNTFLLSHKYFARELSDLETKSKKIIENEEVNVENMKLL